MNRPNALNNFFYKFFSLAIWSACLSFLAIAPSHAQTQRVFVFDQATRQPLPGVSLQIDQSSSSWFTNQKGSVDILVSQEDTRIVFSHLGYESDTIAFATLAGNGFRHYLKPAFFGLEGVVVSASRRSQNRRDVSSAIAVLSTRDREQLQPQTAADMLGMKGEVFIQKSQQGGGSPMIRGFAANRLLYAVDGVRLNNAIFRSGNLHNVISLDPFATEKAEVLFGPASVTYGSDAIGGVMAFQSLGLKYASDDSLRFSGNTQWRYSSANTERTGHVHLTVGSRKLAWTGSVSRYEAGDLRMGALGPDEYLRPYFVGRQDGIDTILTNPDPRKQTPSGYTQWNTLQKVGFRPYAWLEMQYTYHGSFNAGFSRYDRLIEVQPDGRPVSAVWQYGPQRWQMHLLGLSYTRPNMWFHSAQLRLATQVFDESRIDRPFSGNSRYRQRTQSEKVHAWSANLDLERKFSRFDLHYGAEWVYNTVESSGKAIDIRDQSPIPVPDRYPAANWMSLGVFAQANATLSDRWRWHGGIRWNHVGMQTDFSRHFAFYPFDFTRNRLDNQALTGSTGVIWTPAKPWRFTAHAATGFRSPNVDDIGKLFDFAAGEVVVPNGQLLPEYAYHGELNAFYTSASFRLECGVFTTFLDNAMVRRAFQVDGRDSLLFNGVLSKIYAIQNAAYAQVYGGHIAAEYKPLESLTFRLRYNLQRGTEEMDDGSLSASRHAAPAFGVGSLGYTRGKWLLLSQLHFSDAVSFHRLNEEERQKPAIYARDGQGRPWSPGWYRWDFKVLYTFSDRIQFHFSLENITDQRYRPYSSGIAAAGRNWVFALQASF
jgi:hemoglobin/transferrin/lactoferrin receptor protein